MEGNRIRPPLKVKKPGRNIPKLIPIKKPVENSTGFFNKVQYLLNYLVSPADRCTYNGV